MCVHIAGKQKSALQHIPEGYFKKTEGLALPSILKMSLLKRKGGRRLRKQLKKE
jgi:hypothetical protein